MQILCTLPENEHNQHFRISLIVNQWLVYTLLFKLPEYYKLMLQYKPIVVKLSNEKLSGIFLTKLGFCESWIGYLDQSIQTLTDAAKLCEASENAEEAGLAYMFLLQSYLFKSNLDQVFQTKKRFLRVMQQRFEPASYVRVFTYTSMCYAYLGDWPRAIEEGHEALRVAEEYSDDRLISFASAYISGVYTCKGELDKSLEYGKIAVKKAPTLANELWAKATLAWAICKSDETQKGVEILAEVVPIFRIGGQVMMEIYGGTMLGDGYMLAGNYEKAKQTLESCLELAEGCGMKYCIGWIHRLLGEVAMKTYHSEAFSHFKKSIDVLREIKANNELALAYAGLGRLYKQQGNKNHAREYLKKALAIFEQLGTLLEPDKIREDLVGLHET
jgi:tetratricopeptide (TPR) repeat protein